MLSRNAIQTGCLSRGNHLSTIGRTSATNANCHSIIDDRCRTLLQLYRPNFNFPTFSAIVLRCWSCTRVSNPDRSRGLGRRWPGTGSRGWRWRSDGRAATGRVCFGPPEVYLSKGIERLSVRPPDRAVVVRRRRNCGGRGAPGRTGTPVWTENTGDDDDKVSISERDCTARLSPTLSGARLKWIIDRWSPLPSHYIQLSYLRQRSVGI